MAREKLTKGGASLLRAIKGHSAEAIEDAPEAYRQFPVPPIGWINQRGRRQYFADRRRPPSPG